MNAFNRIDTYFADSSTLKHSKILEALPAITFEQVRIDKVFFKKDLQRRRSIGEAMRGFFSAKKNKDKSRRGARTVQLDFSIQSTDDWLAEMNTHSGLAMLNWEERTVVLSNLRCSLTEVHGGTLKVEYKTRVTAPTHQ